jgi:glycosyltransferase involved in cell wall biosynthesis
MHGMTITRLSLVLPSYNEEANIERTVRATDAWFTQAAMDGEIIIVDDGSRDSSPAILERLAKELPRVRVVRHDKNRGYGLAIRSGIDTAKEDVVGFMDSDGQFHPEDLMLLLPHLEQYRFVAGRRRKRADSFVRNTFGKVLGGMNWIVLGLWVRDVNCGLKVFHRDLWPVIRPTHGVEKLFNTELFLHLHEEKIPWLTVDVPHYPRTAGNPTGAKLYVIVRMFKELYGLRSVKKR